MKYIIEAKLSIEVEADDKQAAEQDAKEIFEAIEEANSEKVAKISEARVIDKATGYFVK